MKNREWFLSYQKELAALRYAISNLSYECSTDLPKKAIAYQQEMMDVLSKQHLKLERDLATIERIETMDLNEFDEVEQQAILKLRKQIREEKDCDEAALHRFISLRPKSEAAWIAARQAADFDLFADELEAMIEVKKALVAHLPGASVYDKILNQQEEGTSMAMYDALFDEIKATVVPLLQQIAKQPKRDTSILEGNFPKQQQKAYLEHLQTVYGFDKEAGAMGESQHPFCNGLSTTNVRFTVAYHEHNPMLAVSSSMHEMGHALYEQQSNPMFCGTVLNEKSAAMHEGQSRFYENMVGNTEAFWKGEYPVLQRYFPQYKGVDVTAFYRALNVVSPSLIRIEADELTYPLHIMIRYEIEKQMFNGEVSIQELPKLWNELYKSYLGIDVPNDAQGILQDIHFSWGYFGYFPTYVLGSAFACQFAHYMKQTLDVDALLEQGDLKPINAWLKEEIHQYAGSKTNELLFEGMGEAFNPKYYTRYLVAKFTQIYDL